MTEWLSTHTVNILPYRWKILLIITPCSKHALKKNTEIILKASKIILSIFSVLKKWSKLFIIQLHFFIQVIFPIRLVLTALLILMWQNTEPSDCLKTVNNIMLHIISHIDDINYILYTNMSSIYFTFSTIFHITINHIQYFKTYYVHLTHRYVYLKWLCKISMNTMNISFYMINYIWYVFNTLYLNVTNMINWYLIQYYT